MKEWFVINDLDEFTQKARLIVFNNFGQWENGSELDHMMEDMQAEDKDDFDRLLSQDESLVIIKDIAKKQTHKQTQEMRYIISEKMFVDIVEQLNNRMISNILQSLVNKGLVESSYDSSLNDFVFWVKDEDSSKPETS